jgi:hypothetical protein
MSRLLYHCDLCSEDRDNLGGLYCSLCGHTLRRNDTTSPETRDEAVVPLNFDFFEYLLGGFNAELRSHLQRALNLTPADSPISTEFLKNIGRVTVDDRAGILLDITLNIGPYRAMLIPAEFGPLPAPSSALSGRVVWADPQHGETELQNAQELQNAIVLFRRGKVPFAEKVQRAQLAGAAAAIVCQSFDVWPFVMTDSSVQDGIVRIPVYMLSRPDAEIIDGIFSGRKRGVDVEGHVQCLNIDCLCSICHDVMKSGDIVLKLHCRHCYHDSCVLSWLEAHNTCPLCRKAMPIDTTANASMLQSVSSGAASSTAGHNQPYFL